jgi:hypothetical protein
MLSLAKTPNDLGIIQRSLGADLYKIGAVVSLPVYEPGEIFGPVAFPQYLFRDYVVPYFRFPYIYVIHHEPLYRPMLAIDYSVTFDTNFATYVKAIVRSGSLEGQQQEVKHAMDEMLFNNVNFDLFFYFVENIKVAYPIVLRMRNKELKSGLTFWKSLDKDFRWNIVCLKLFRNIDTRHYQKTRMLKFNIGFREAVQESIDFTYKFYASAEGKELIGEIFLPLQRLILTQLLAILRIEFASKKGPREKLKQFLDFVQDKGWVYLERETILAHRYFKSRLAVPMLEKINKGGKQRGLLKKIDNLAWDMTAARFMEMMVTRREKGDYMVPFLFSFDNNLRDLVRTFPAKAVIIDRVSDGVLTIPELNTREYFEKEGCGDIIDSFFSPEKMSARFSRGRVEAKEQLSHIRSEYKALRMAMQV